MDALHFSLVVALVALAGNVWLLRHRVARLERDRRAADVAFASQAVARDQLLSFLESAMSAAAAPPAGSSQGGTAR